ncbi:type I polyketide synthase [Nocardiopsis alborubida]|uniref:Type I polyketide synthase n=1 Tax=Nocardiopsis alborubida TaxID=146802 RepID=A0A7X6RNZ6_9ACTN|nr:type I polyketide synthase [Nocardiopsis alborubida]NKY96652.1 type I polyketide synthase [Nocardiopsis alborubida]
MTTTASTNREPVAIIGMGCRLPGGIATPTQLWEALVQGLDCVTRVPDERWKQMVERLHPDQVPAEPFPAGVVDVDAFDHAFFGIGPDEAAEMDPQQKLLMETAHEALADASLRPSSLAASATGVYVGAASTDQASVNFGPGHRAGVNTGSGAGMAILANRISYLLDLDGPSLAFDTACSSSLTALHYAVRDLRAGAVEVAIVAGTNILTSPVITAGFVEAGVLSPDGRCRPFDFRANGYVRSEGTVVLVLTRAAIAQGQGHRVWAHVAGTAIGHGGASRHLLRPRVDRQAAVIRQALADAAVRPAQVGWVQAHGTGTRAGDRIEAEGIAQALGRDKPVPVGSVKAALGHLEGGAGTLGVMVTALAVHHGKVPPTLHHSTLRHRLEGLVRVPTTVEDWPADAPSRQEETRVAGVSSFGFGGANAHAIVTSAPAMEPPPEQDPMPLPETVLVSARSPVALSSAAGRLAERAPQGRSVGTVADTALAHGIHHPHRAAVVASDLGALVQGLRSIQDGVPNADVIGPGCTPQLRPRLVFVYTGHGGHHPDAGAELLRVPAFAHALHQARVTVEAHTGSPVWQPGQNIEGFADAQHCTYLVQVGLTALLAERGITPNAVMGHSVGEIAAALTAGALPQDAAARVLAHRSRLLRGLFEAGGLLALRAGAKETEEFLAAYGGRVSIASYSAPRVQVVAGPDADLLNLHAHLDVEGVWSRPVADVIPAHSPAVDPFVPELEQALSGLRVQVPGVPIISTAYPGDDTAEAGLWGPAYWAAQARQPVRFTDALHRAVDASDGGPVVFVEIGPKGLLVEHIAHTVDASHHTVAVTTDPTGLARAVGELYTLGVAPAEPTSRAHPHMVIPPGWDHTTGPNTGAESDRSRTPLPGGVKEHLVAEISRLLHLPDGVDLSCSWLDLGMESHQLLQLTSRLRRVHHWRQVDIQLFLPERPLSRVLEDLQALLPAPSTISEGRPSVLP